MADKIILYDLPVLRDGKHVCFSFNPWKTRMALNYKNIPYETEFVEYPDLEPELKKLGVPPNPSGSFADYTSPTIRLPDGAFVVDSANIAAKLEALHPTPLLHLDSGVHDAVAEAINAVAIKTGLDSTVALLGIMPPRSSEWFAADREKRLGMPLADFAAKHGGEPAWQAAEAPGGCLEGLRDVLTKHRRDEGPFVLGSQPSYGDFVAVGLFECYKTVHGPSFERLMKFDETFPRLYAACAPWLERDDH